ncbi:unnamed protein product [Victoria cruziana]
MKNNPNPTGFRIRIEPLSGIRSLWNGHQLPNIPDPSGTAINCRTGAARYWDRAELADRPRRGPTPLGRPSCGGIVAVDGFVPATGGGPRRMKGSFFQRRFPLFFQNKGGWRWPTLNPSFSLAQEDESSAKVRQRSLVGKEKENSAGRMALVKDPSVSGGVDRRQVSFYRILILFIFVAFRD